MKCIKLSIFSSLAIAASLISASCSSDVETVAEESAVKTTEDGTAIEEEVTTSPLITVTINNAAKNTVTYSRAIQTDDEKAVESMQFYIFMRADDGEYYYYGNPTFTANEDYTYTYSIYDDVYLLGETIQVLLVANDAVDVSEAEDKDVLTLDEFKEALATASVSTSDYVDALVGGFPGSSSETGFPMTATATDSYGEKEFEVTITGVELDATLIRTMARIDIINYATNLTVTDVYVSNTPNKSYLFAQDTEPTTSEYVTLKALSAYFDELGNFTTDEDENNFVEKEATDDDDDKYITTMKQVLYMYEQSCSDTYPTVFISYELENSDYAGTVGVPFSTMETVERNHRYIIELAKSDDTTDGANEVSFSADVSFTVSADDWELGDTVEENLEFEETTSED